MTFIVLIFMLLLYYKLCNKKYELGSRVFITIMCIVLILLSGLRHEGVGIDTLSYLRNFENNANLSWADVFDNFFTRFFFPSVDNSKDPGYFVFLKLLHTFHINKRIFLFIIATLTIVPFGIFTYQNSKNLKTVLFAFGFYLTLFYGYLPNSAIRQSLALSFILWAYLFLCNKKIFKGVCLIVVGATFHKTALIVLVLIPILYLKNIQKVYKCILLPFIVTLMFPETIAQLLVGSNEVYSGYSDGSYYENNQGSKPYVIILLITLFYIIGWVYIRKLTMTFIKQRMKLLFLGCALTFMLIPLIWSDPAAIRVISYFAPCMGIIVGASLSYNKEIRFLFPLLFAAFLYRSISVNDNYFFMWQMMELHERYL